MAGARNCNRIGNGIVIANIESLHALFCRLTGLEPGELDFRFFAETWKTYVTSGFDDNDLRLVIGLIKSDNARQERQFKRKLRIRDVIEDIPRFAEDLAEARRRQRLKLTARESVLKDYRKFTPERDAKALRVVGEILKANGMP